MDLVTQIRREREAVSYGIYGVYVLQNVGPEADPARLLNVKIAYENVEENDIQAVGQYIHPYRLKMNRAFGGVTINRLSAMLVGTVCELLKDEDKGRLWQYELSGEPTIQFLRHVRNGIFHGNRFTFDHGPTSKCRLAWLGDNFQNGR